MEQSSPAIVDHPGYLAPEVRRQHIEDLVFGAIVGGIMHSVPAQRLESPTWIRAHHLDQGINIFERSMGYLTLEHGPVVFIWYLEVLTDIRGEHTERFEPLTVVLIRIRPAEEGSIPS
jgi:hypothetical protein